MHVLELTKTLLRTDRTEDGRQQSSAFLLLAEAFLNGNIFMEVETMKSVKQCGNYAESCAAVTMIECS